MRKTIVVCVKNANEAERLIKVAKMNNMQNVAQIKVVTVFEDSNNQTVLQQMDDIYTISKKYSADSTVMFSKKEDESISEFIKQVKPYLVVTGLPTFTKISVVDYIKMDFPNITLAMVDKNNIIYRILPNMMNMPICS